MLCRMTDNDAPWGEVLDPRTYNPAGRLHYWLEKYNRTLASSTATMANRIIWSKVMESEPSAVRLPIYRLIALVPEIDRAVSVIGMDFARELFTSNVEAWVEPLAPVDNSWVQSTARVSDSAMAALRALSELINGALPARSAVAPDALGEIEKGAFDLLANLAEATDLDPKLRSLLQQRIDDVMWAAMHVQLVGVDGVQAACDRLAMSLVTSSEAKAHAALLNAGLNFVARAYTLISFADTVSGGVPAIGSTIDAIVKASGIGS